MSTHLDFAVETAMLAGDIFKQHFLSDMQAKTKQDFTPVTIADTKINQLVIDRVAEFFPDDSVLGEEQSNITGSERVWVCDPIDGTHFAKAGVAISVFMLALVEDGTPTVAVIYEPVTGKLFTAEKGSGAFLNGEPVKVSDGKLEKRNWVDICDIINHPVVDLRPLSNELYDRGIKVGGVRVSGIVATMVAEGHLIAGVTPSVHPHDVAALKLIIEEAGGKVTDVFGNEQRYDCPVQGAVFSNGVVHNELVEIIRKTSAKK